MLALAVILFKETGVQNQEHFDSDKVVALTFNEIQKKLSDLSMKLKKIKKESEKLFRKTQLF